MTDQIEKLEAQVNALAQGWLRLVAMLEVEGVVKPERIDQVLLPIRWPGQPIEGEATKTIAWLCDQLAGARDARRTSR
ncbi:hypothetical protein [Pseudomonas sp. RT6P73]